MAFIFKSLGNSSYSWVNNLSSEEKGEESTEESAKKTKTLDCSDDLFLNNKVLSAFTNVASVNPNLENIFPSSDYSEEVFFPPEVL
jgi:hypothetical protein